MIDIIFLLIIFFMTTAQFVQQARVDLELPVEIGEDQSEVRLPPLVVNVLAEGGDRPFVVGGEQMNLDSVLALVDADLTRLAENGAGPNDLELTVRADRRGLSGVINELGTALRKRGVARWRLATEQPR